jgi:type VI secretion system protein ImpK
MPPPMNFPGFRESLLLAQLRDFYMEVLRLKTAIRSSHPTFSADANSVEAAGLELTPHAVHHTLHALLERQALDADRSGGAFAYEVYREAQYVFAALGDEVFLNLDWTGSKAWPLLESKLFQSHVAGELFFDKVDQLLYKRDPAYEDLAAVYFVALSLGFKGKFRGTDSTAQIDRYRSELFVKIFHQHPHLLTEDRSLFPQSYLHTLNEGKAKMLPDPRNWLALIPAVILLWVLLSTMLWVGLTQRIDSTLCSIDPASCSQAPGGR